MEKKVTYTEVEADALLDQAKRLARESGRSVRVEAESLLSRNRKTRLGDHRDKARGVGELLAALAAEFDDLRAESGDDDGELAAIVAMLAASFEAFTSRPPDHPYSTTGAAEPGAGALLPESVDALDHDTGHGPSTVTGPRS